MSNLAYQDDIYTELLDGKTVAMSPRPAANHNIVAGNIYRIFGNFLKGKSCIALADGMDVFLTKKDRVIPDTMIICNRDIIKKNGVHGVPDLIVEILSPSTATKDKGYKKNLYEKCGVKEYWLVDTDSRSIEVHLLTDGKFVLDQVYYIFPDYLIEKMTEEEKSGIIYEFKTSLYSDLVITLEDVFENIL